jgi:hypothetical protein
VALQFGADGLEDAGFRSGVGAVIGDKSADFSTTTWVMQGMQFGDGFSSSFGPLAVAPPKS